LLTTVIREERKLHSNFAASSFSFEMNLSHNKVTAAGLLIALGIIFGDIGTSPLYVLNAITNGKRVTEELIIGALFIIIWTLNRQTTVK